VAVNPPENLLDQLTQDERGLLRSVGRILPADKLVDLVLVIDQFEELFTLVEDEDTRAAFLESLVTALLDEHSRLRVVITLRADFTDRPLEYVDFGELLRQRTEFVLPLTPDELELAITQPARGAGLALEPGLSERIIRDLGEQPGTLPLLQYALTELFERRSGRRLTLSAYQDSGGVLGALGVRAEMIYFTLDSLAQETARQVFLRLVTLGEGLDDTRRRVLQSELEALTPSSFDKLRTGSSPINGRGLSRERSEREEKEPVPDSLREVRVILDSFGGARLLSFDHDPLTRSPTVEVAHEALLREWPRLREWLDQSRSDIRNQRVLGNAAADWLEAEQDPSFLLRGARLDQFAAWSETTDLALTQVEGDYLDASLAFEAQRKAQQATLERRSRNFLRALVVVFAVAAIVAVGLTLFAFNQQGIAQENALQADQNAATAQAEAFARGTQQAIAESEADRRATQQAIAESEAILRADAEQVALDERDRAVDAEQEALLQASIGLAGQSLNEMDGFLPERAVPLALEALEDYPYTWQAQRALGEAVLNHRLELVFSHDGAVNSLELSHNGQQLLTGGRDGTVRVWDPSNGEQLLTLFEPKPDPFTAVGWMLLTQPEGNPVVAKWSPDETSILTVRGDGLAFQVWDAETGSLLYSRQVDSKIRYHPKNWFPWSPQGDRFVTAQNNEAVIWDAAAGTELSTLSGHEGIVRNASWSPSGDYIVTPSFDNTAILWDANSGLAISTFPGTDWYILFASWSPSGDRFALRGLGRVTIYETATGAEVLNIPLPGLWTQGTGFSPDGTKFITTIFQDGTARLFDAETGELLSILSGLTQGRGVSWSPSGDLAAVVGADGSVRIWDTVTGLELQKLPFFGSDSVEWSPAGDRVYAAGRETTDIKVFELSPAILTFPGMPGLVGYGAWSPDGQQVGRTFSNGIAKVWSVATGKEVFNLETGIGSDQVSGVKWSPSGDRILTWNDDNTTRVWDAASGELLLEFTGHEGGIFYGDWSPDGSRIVTGGFNDGKVFVWDSATGEQIWQVTPPGAEVSFAKWSPDGNHLVTTGDNGQGTIRDAATGEVFLQLFPEGYPDWVEGAAWSHDGKRIVILSSGTGQVFDTTNGKVLSKLSSGLTSAWVVHWSPTDELIFTLGGDGIYRSFDAATGTELLVYEIGGFPSGALSPDGTQMLIGTNDGATSIYPTWKTPEELIAYARECCILRELTPEERQLFGLPPR
jgi:WD40 repeat protein